MQSVALFVGAVKDELAPTEPMFILLGKLGVKAATAVKEADEQAGQAADIVT